MVSPEALITNRDGIVGTWSKPAGVPAPLELDSPDNLVRWEQNVRGSLFNFEMFSRLGFTAGPGERVTVWHLEQSAAADPDDPPGAAYQRLCRLTRPDQDVFKAQLDMIAGYADLRPDRTAEIMAEVETVVPFLGSIAYLRPDRTQWTIELLACAFRLARFVEMRVKHALACRRANEFSPQIQPMIQTPGHGSLPSGHSTESFTMATVLLNLLRAGANPVYDDPSYGVELMRQAARIAINRTVAGVHFPADSMAGCIL
ncbi:MAG TPA: phosphatase PAP2 family protein, partial [Alphaproteobacteria bacterium]|nr:phosphatase PAP2 family protein [Alphaproteobacteria bacterium]